MHATPRSSRKRRRRSFATPSDRRMIEQIADELELDCLEEECAENAQSARAAAVIGQSLLASNISKDARLKSAEERVELEMEQRVRAERALERLERDTAQLASENADLRRRNGVIVAEAERAEKVDATRQREESDAREASVAQVGELTKELRRARSANEALDAEVRRERASGDAATQRVKKLSEKVEAISQRLKAQTEQTLSAEEHAAELVAAERLAKLASCRKDASLTHARRELDETREALRRSTSELAARGHALEMMREAHAAATAHAALAASAELAAALNEARSRAASAAEMMEVVDTRSRASSASSSSSASVDGAVDADVATAEEQVAVEKSAEAARAAGRARRASQRRVIAHKNSLFKEVEEQLRRELAQARASGVVPVFVAQAEATAEAATKAAREAERKLQEYEERDSKIEHTTLMEFFMLTAMSIKVSFFSSTGMQPSLTLSNEELYQEAISLEVPYHQWHDFISDAVAPDGYEKDAAAAAVKVVKPKKKRGGWLFKR